MECGHSSDSAQEAESVASGALRPRHDTTTVPTTTSVAPPIVKASGISPKNAALSVNLQSFEVRRKNSQNQYSYKMILTKSGKSTKKVQGGASVVIRGENGSGISELKMKDLRLENPGKDTKFAFRYFQVFEGDIALPDGFEPFEVEIGIKPSSKKLKSFSETITWTRVLTEGV